MFWSANSFIKTITILVKTITKYINPFTNFLKPILLFTFFFVGFLAYMFSSRNSFFKTIPKFINPIMNFVKLVLLFTFCFPNLLAFSRASPCLVWIEVLSGAYAGTSPRGVFCIHKDSNLRPLLKRPKSLPLEPTLASALFYFSSPQKPRLSFDGLFALLNMDLLGSI